MSTTTNKPTEQQVKQHEAARKAAYWIDKAKQALEYAAARAADMGNEKMQEDLNITAGRVGVYQQDCWRLRNELRRQFPNHLGY